MAADKSNGDQINYDLFRKFAEVVDAAIKLLIQNLTQKQTKESDNKKAEDLKDFNQLMYQAAEFGAVLEKIIQKQIQQAFYESKLDDFRMMEKQIENKLREQRLHELAADDPLALQYQKLLIQESNSRLNDLNKKIEKLRENIAIITQQLAGKHAQIKEDNKFILQNFQTLLTQARQYFSSNPSALNFQIDGEQTNINHDHFFNELQKYINIHHESINENNFSHHVENFSVLYMAENFSHQPEETREKIAKNISQVLPSKMQELEGYSNLVNSFHTRDKHVAEAAILNEQLVAQVQAVEKLMDEKPGLDNMSNANKELERKIDLETTIASRQILENFDISLQELEANFDASADFLKMIQSSLQQALNPDQHNVQDIIASLNDNAQLNLNEVDLNLDGLNLNAPLADINANLDLGADFDFNADLNLGAALDLDAPLDLDGDLDQIPNVAPPAYEAEPPEAPPLNAANAPAEAAPPAYSVEPEPIPRQSATAKIADLLKIKITNPANQANPVAEAAAAAGYEQKPPSYEASRRNNNAPAEPANNPEDQPPSYSPRNR
jgi:hypothetical protein